MADAQTQQQTTQVEFKHTEDFSSLYANSVRLESSVWDLKLIFGELDQSAGKEVVMQHTAISLPWVQVKLMIHLLQVNLAGHELENGKVHVPLRVVQPELQLPPELENNDQAKALRDLANKMRAEFISNL